MLWVFRELSNYKNYYVTDCGKVVSNKTGNLYVKCSRLRMGYPVVGLLHDKVEYIHRLVAQAFIPNPDNKPQVNHKDGNKLNNHVSNLEWCTNQENLVHARQTGLNTSPKGAEHYSAKLGKKQVLEIRENKLNLSQRDLAKMFSVSRPTIQQIINRTIWRHI